MSQGYPDMYQDFSSHRSPGATRYNGVTLNRQPSRHFNEFQQLQGQYMENDFVPRYESERYGRGLAAPVQTHHPYENQTWSYGGANAAHSMSGTGRVNAAPRGRPALPPVSHYTMGPNGIQSSIRMLTSFRSDLDGTAANNSHPQPQPPSDEWALQQSITSPEHTCLPTA